MTFRYRRLPNVGRINLEQLTFSQGQSLYFERHTSVVMSHVRLSALDLKRCRDDRETDSTWFCLQVLARRPRRPEKDGRPRRRKYRSPRAESERRRGEEIAWERD